MPYHVRLLTPEDQTAAWKLGSLAFGYHDREMPQDWTSDTPGRLTWGAFDDLGRLVAKAVDREQGQWFGGRIVPASGIAGVVVAPEWRGQGLARLVITRLLAAARDRGAAISTLFPTTPFPYRRMGWEQVGALSYTAIPAMALASVRAVPGVTLRPAEEADVPAIHEIYRAVAQTGTGMIERSGPLFTTTDADLLADFNGVTVAVGREGTVEGYASWDRGPGYDETGKITVHELIATTPAATSTLLAMFAGWASVAPNLVFRFAFDDPARLAFSSASARVESHQPWMIRMVDVAGAVAARGWPTHLHGQVDLELEDEACPWNAGAHRLVLSGGQGKLEAGGNGEVRLTERGLGLLYAGAAAPSVLRRAGFLSGGDTRTDEFLQAATAGPVPTLHDYF